MSMEFPCLEACKELKAAGFPQDAAEMVWCCPKQPFIADIPFMPGEETICAAPTIQEMLVFLRKRGWCAMATWNEADIPDARVWLWPASEENLEGCDEQGLANARCVSLADALANAIAAALTKAKERP